MGSLTDQFINAAHEWAERTSTAESTITDYVMFYTGGAWFQQPVGQVDLAGFPAERKRDVTVGEVIGHYTVEQMRGYLEKLVTRVHMHETFLIVALVRAIEDDFARACEDSADRIRAEQQQELEEIAADPARREEHLRLMNEQRRRSEPFDEASLQNMMELLRRLSSPEQERERRLALEVWREVTAPIVQPENLEQSQ